MALNPSFKLWSVRILSFPSSVTVDELARTFNLPPSRIRIPTNQRYVRYYVMINGFDNEKAARDFTSRWSGSFVFDNNINCKVFGPQGDDLHNQYPLSDLPKPDVKPHGNPTASSVKYMPHSGSNSIGNSSSPKSSSTSKPYQSIDTTKSFHEQLPSNQRPKLNVAPQTAKWSGSNTNIPSDLTEMQIWIQLAGHEATKVMIHPTRDIDDLKKVVLKEQDGIGSYQAVYRNRQLGPGEQVPLDTTSDHPVVLRKINKPLSVDPHGPSHVASALIPNPNLQNDQSFISTDYHIVIDFSNIAIGAQTVPTKVPGITQKNPAIRINVKNLVKVLEENKLQINIKSRIIGGSKPPENEILWDEWRSCGYTCIVGDRSIAGKEVFVDDMLHAQILSILARYNVSHRRQVLLLVTGDGNRNHGQTSFPNTVEMLLIGNWTVELWSWKPSLSDTYFELSGLNLYHANRLRNGSDRDCLYYYVPEKMLVPEGELVPHGDLVSQLIPYCIRFHLDEELTNLTNHHQSFTFEQLRTNNVSSLELYTWSAPIDLVEQYQIYLENISSINTFLYYNCTYPWFGLQCEYTFDYPQSSFAQQVEMNFNAKDKFPKEPFSSHLPCYTYLVCDRVRVHGKMPGACLDWREICDGKIDCLDGGHDEEHCWHLEINECDSETEYRCRNGVCIPSIFLDDDKENSDCLDRTDESHVDSVLNNWNSADLRYIYCYRDPTSRCEDRMCPLYKTNDYTLECGDGSCQNPTYFSCKNMRDFVLTAAFYTEMNASSECRVALYCIMWSLIRGTYHDKTLEDCDIHDYYLYAMRVQEHCPSLVELSPIMFGHVHFVYTNDHFLNFKPQGGMFYVFFIPPVYICYNVNVCGSNILSDSLNSLIDPFNNNSTCQSFNTSKLSKTMFYTWNVFVTTIHSLFYQCSNYYQLLSISNSSYLYACTNSSKVISQHRLVDGIQDCLYGDDESFANSCLLNDTKYRFKCKFENNTVCFARTFSQVRFYDCDDQFDKNDPQILKSTEAISFQTMCDGKPEISPPIVINGRNETDETECSHFSCNNTYTRCDGFWNCVDGADEINCEWPPFCPPLYHMCVSRETRNLTCLSFQRINDNIIDCLGATDEQKYCRQSRNHNFGEYYLCSNNSKCIEGRSACQRPYPQQCPDEDQLPEYMCEVAFGDRFNYCWEKQNMNQLTQFLCTISRFKKLSKMHFSLIGNTSYSFVWMTETNSTSTAISTTNKMNNDDVSKWNASLAWYCNRGIVIRRVKNNGNDSELICLCPPAYYGRLCEYQNERISLIVKIKVLFDWRTIFVIVMILHNDEKDLIESYEQVNHLPSIDCDKKFSINLLYTNRPKNQSTKYSVRFHVYDKKTLEHRGSWIFPVLFPFLPVQSMAVYLQIPLMKPIVQECEELECGINGHCLKYINTNISFCQYDRHRCNCSSGSLCLDSSLCICPLGKFGDRCYLKHPICSCENGGTCLQDDIRLTKSKGFWCICSEGFSGSRCEKVDTKIVISFEFPVLSQTRISVHFIEVFNKTIPHIQTTLLKKIPFHKDTITIAQSQPFHIIFVKIEEKQELYRLLLQIEYKYSSQISLTVTNSHRCWPMNQLFNESFNEIHLLRRIKLYHIPCKERTNLACFYDNDYMCICNDTLQQANCFLFNDSVDNYNCKEGNICKNGGFCFHDQPKCPSLSTCVCDDCSYGSQCQFSTKGFALSLDTILGYQIRPNESIARQRASIKVTIAITTIMLLFGFISNILSIMTFYRKKARQTGYGSYLLIASLISISIIIIYTFKLFFLMGSQMGLIINRNYLLFNCILIDYLIKCLLNIIDWLYVCVSIERTVAAITDVKFNKNKAKQAYKWVVIGICLFTFLSYIHDPIHRQLIDDYDDDQRRIWCIVDYNTFFKSYNTVILLIHSLLPFIFNIISAIIIIITIARQKSTVQQQLTYKQHLRKQFYALKRLLISPFILILLALPQLIISFSSGCMKSNREPWLYLFGYFIQFIPSMLIFFIFVLPSDIYKNEFNQTIQRLRRYLSCQ